ncbi:MAG TPA: M20/M25/M40 family metallo-hydrolase [Bryobacteraceae bacterium]|jgi:Zn-dependent M28 family amino/carboxypeptidase
MLRKAALAGLIILPLPLLIFAQQQAQQQTEHIDLNVIHKLKTAELGGGGNNNAGGGGAGGRGAARRPPLMETLYSLTDRYGPRLTNSPQYRAAGDWAVTQLKDWGLSNVHLEPFTTVPAPGTPADEAAATEAIAAGGRGPTRRPAIPSWQLTSYSGAMVEPSYMPIIGYPQAWSGGTTGPLTAQVIQAPQIQTLADMDKFHGKAAGKIVLLVPEIELPLPTTPLATRYSDEQLNNLIPEVFPAGRGGRGAAATPQMTPQEQQTFTRRQTTYWKDEGALATITASNRGQSGTVFANNGASREGDPTKNIPALAITAEHYNRIARLLEHNVPVKLSFDIKVEWDTTKTEAFNVIAEIPGATKPNELVMVGGHFDSWHMGTGATDNAVGSAVAMEVMRLLKTSNLKMDRTVRMALWSGEEEGELGSTAYVKDHFADPNDMKLKPEHNGFAGYFNIDNGTGKIRGIYLQGNETERPIFDQWFAAIKDLTPGTITIRNTGGTDHQSFDAVGLPGFQFIQDPLDYDSRTHHSNMDTFERVQQADIEQMAIIEAYFVYNAATRPDKLPRKDLPTPRQTGGRGGRGAARPTAN